MKTCLYYAKFWDPVVITKMPTSHHSYTAFSLQFNAIGKTFKPKPEFSRYARKRNTSTHAIL